MILENDFTVTVPMERLFDALTDHARVGGCLAGAKVGDRQPDGAVPGQVRVPVAGTTITYRGTLRPGSADREAGALAFRLEAREMRGTGTISAAVDVRLRESFGSTTASMRSDVEVSGRGAALAPGVLADGVQRLLRDFAVALQRALDGEAAQAVAAAASATPEVTEDDEAASATLAAVASVAAVEAPPAEAPAVRGTVRVMTEVPLPIESVRTSDSWSARVQDLVTERPWLIPLLLLGGVVLVLLLRHRDGDQ